MNGREIAAEKPERPPGSDPDGLVALLTQFHLRQMPLQSSGGTLGPVPEIAVRHMRENWRFRHGGTEQPRIPAINARARGAGHGDQCLCGACGAHVNSEPFGVVRFLGRRGVVPVRQIGNHSRGGLVN